MLVQIRTWNQRWFCISRRVRPIEALMKPIDMPHIGIDRNEPFWPSSMASGDLTPGVRKLCGTNKPKHVTARTCKISKVTSQFLVMLFLHFYPVQVSGGKGGLT